MDYFKIAVLNNSGNVGKSTVCQTFLMPRIANAELIRVETINNDGLEEKGVSAHNMTQVIEKIDNSSISVIDIGSSNIENFMSGLKRNKGSHEDIDFFLVPTTPEVKQQKDTISTIDDLLDMNIQHENIGLLLNKVDDRAELDRQFKTLLDNGILKMLKKKSLNEFPIIHNSELFLLLEQIQQNYDETLNDETDYKTAIRATEDKRERSILSIKRTAMRLTKAHDDQLNAEFNKLEFS